MKRIIKRSFFILTLTLLVFSFISCKGGKKNKNTKTESYIEDSNSKASEDEISDSSIDYSSSDIIDSEPWKSGKTVEGNKIEYDLKQEDIDLILSNLDYIKSICETDDETKYDVFIEFYNIVKDMRNVLDDASKKESLKYYMYGTIENLNRSDEFNNYRFDLLQWISDVEHIIYDNNGDIKQIFYKGLTNDEILDYIGINYPDDYYQKKKRLSELESNYLALDEKSETYLDEIDEIFVEYVNLGNEFVDIYYDGIYDNYYDYMFKEVYGRDYRPKDTYGFYDNIMDYILPLSSFIEAKYDEIRDELDDDSLELLDTIISGDSFTECFDIIEAYKDYMGGDFKNVFDDLFKDGGNYYISYDNDGYSGAYVETLGIESKDYYPIAFFGPHNHDSSTIIHEFGHYFNGYINRNDNSPMDLFETHSQADEYLFYQFLFQELFKDNEALADALKCYFLQDDYEYLVYFAMVSEVERLCYEKDNLQLGDLKNICHELYTKNTGLNVFGPTERSLYRYTQNVTMYSPGYYISYATSLIGALNINRIAEDNFNDAKDSYYKLINHNGIDGYVDVYEYAGLKNPFEEDTFKYIFGESYQKVIEDFYNKVCNDNYELINDGYVNINVYNDSVAYYDYIDKNKSDLAYMTVNDTETFKAIINNNTFNIDNLSYCDEGTLSEVLKDTLLNMFKVENPWYNVSTYQDDSLMVDGNIMSIKIFGFSVIRLVNELCGIDSITSSDLGNCYLLYDLENDKYSIKISFSEKSNINLDDLYIDIIFYKDERDYDLPINDWLNDENRNYPAPKTCWSDEDIELFQTIFGERYDVSEFIIFPDFADYTFIIDTTYLDDYKTITIIDKYVDEDGINNYIDKLISKGYILEDEEQYNGYIYECYHYVINEYENGGCLYASIYIYEDDGHYYIDISKYYTLFIVDNTELETLLIEYGYPQLDLFSDYFDRMYAFDIKNQTNDEIDYRYIFDFSLDVQFEYETFGELVELVAYAKAYGNMLVEDYEFRFVENSNPKLYLYQSEESRKLFAYDFFVDDMFHLYFECEKFIEDDESKEILNDLGFKVIDLENYVSFCNDITIKYEKLYDLDHEMVLDVNLVFENIDDIETFINDYTTNLCIDYDFIEVTPSDVLIYEMDNAFYNESLGLILCYEIISNDLLLTINFIKVSQAFNPLV